MHTDMATKILAQKDAEPLNGHVKMKFFVFKKAGGVLMAAFNTHSYPCREALATRSKVISKQQMYFMLFFI